jgi:transcriptional regulator with XRE-family HTH domain
MDEKPVDGYAVDDDAYAAIGLDFVAEEWAPTDPIRRRPALAKLGRAVLQLRLYLGWSQKDLEARSGVDQTTISRLERGKQRGLSIRRLAKILDALQVGEIVFDKRPSVPQTDLEIMLYGDSWKRAVAEADRRLGWTEATPNGPTAGFGVPG